MPKMPPRKPLLVAYWLSKEVTQTFACPPLKDIADFQLKDGSPQVAVVPLFAAGFQGTPQDFKPPYLGINSSTLQALQGGEAAALQRRGIKVVLSVTGDGNVPNGIGWSSIPVEQNAPFARWVRTEVLEKYGLDGIDIDDEFSQAPGQPGQLVATVRALRAEMPDKLITKALWQDSEAFKGTDLGQLLDFGCTMAYGYNFEELKNLALQYAEFGLPLEKLCVGVQAGPAAQQWMTSLETTRQVAQWVKQNGLLGVMLFSYSQDIQQFTTAPQHSQPYPSPEDHAWQAAIVEALYGG